MIKDLVGFSWLYQLECQYFIHYAVKNLKLIQFFSATVLDWGT